MRHRKPKEPKADRREELAYWFNNDMHLTNRLVYLGSPGRDNDESTCVTGAVSATIMKGLLALETEDPTKPISIIMNTTGGVLYDAMAIYDMIKAISCPIVVRAFGACMSAGTIILQAADERVLAPNVSFMIHDGTDGYDGGARDFERWGVECKRQRFKMYEIFAQRSGRPVKFWEKVCVNDSIMSAEKAIELGLADRILECPQTKRPQT
jgi:ATP-dependent Clp protease protease subunit